MDAIDGRGNIEVLFQQAVKRYYLIHNQCYENIKNNEAGISFFARKKHQLIKSNVSTDKTGEDIKKERSQVIEPDENDPYLFYGVKIKGFHPLSTKLLFQIDKIAQVKKILEENGEVVLLLMLF